MLKIGNLELSSQVVVAPIAGYTDLAFRNIMREYSSSLMFAEMVSVTGLSAQAKGSLRRFRYDPTHHPLGVQLFGCDPEKFYDAARSVQDEGVDLVDVNFGCPKVPGEQLAGSRLMQFPDQVRKIVRNMRKAATEIPITVKIRAGMDGENVNCVEIAKIAYEEGADAVTIHGRTCQQKFSGSSNWDYIRDVVEAVPIPVIANGDIDTPEKARETMEYTGAAAVMIGRAALGRQWVIQQMDRYLKGLSIPLSPTPEETRDVVLRHLEYSKNLLGDAYLRQTMRKVVSMYFKQVPKVRQLRRHVNDTKDYATLCTMLYAFPEEILSPDEASQRMNSPSPSSP